MMDQPRPKVDSDNLPDGTPRCEALRSFLMEVKGKPQVLYVRCHKGAEHHTPWHGSKSPVTGKDLKWDDTYQHARYLEEED